MGTGLSGVTVAILAGGLGTRLRHRVGDRPKILAPVAGRPFIFHLLDQISGFGVRRVVLCTGYRAAQVYDAVGGCYGPMDVVYSNEEGPLGTAGALRRAQPHFRSDPALVLNGDSYCQVDLEGFLAWHTAQCAPASLLLAEVSDTSRFGRVKVSNAGDIVSFDEKSVRGRGWINAGVYCLGKTFLDSIPDAGFVSLEKDVFPTWVGNGLKGYRSAAGFIDIGTDEDYSRADRFFGLLAKGRAT